MLSVLFYYAYSIMHILLCIHITRLIQHAHFIFCSIFKEVSLLTVNSRNILDRYNLSINSKYSNLCLYLFRAKYVVRCIQFYCIMNISLCIHITSLIQQAYFIFCSILKEVSLLTVNLSNILDRYNWSISSKYIVNYTFVLVSCKR